MLKFQNYIGNLALGLTGSFLLIRFAYDYFNSLIKKVQLDITLLAGSAIHATLIIFFLTIYPSFVRIVDSTMMSITSEIRSQSALVESSNLQDMNEAFDEDKKAATAGKISWLWENLSLKMGLNNIFGFLSSVIAFVMLLLAIVQVKLLTLIGPLPIAFSIIPMFQNSFPKWMNGLMEAYAAILLIYILDLFASGLTSSVLDGAGQKDQIPVELLLLLNIVVVVIYMNVFKYASLIVGDDIGSSMVTQMYRIVNIGADGVTKMLSSIR